MKKNKILHICLASHYTDGMTYQDNQLSEQNALDGHEVVVISDCFKYEGHCLIEVDEEDRILSSEVRLIRIKYDHIINRVISSKIRKVRRLKTLIESIKPDVILFHGVAGYELITVARYKKENPHVKLYVDNHEDRHNSGTVWVSLFFQYRIFNNIIVKLIRKHVDKFLYISYESQQFLSDIYGLKENEMEFYPLGGKLLSREEKHAFRLETRNLHRISENQTLIVHSGKFAKEKKTEMLLNVFYENTDPNIILFLIGSIPDQMKDTLDALILRDPRVKFLGWKSAQELVKYLAAADLYFQPGTQSATMQNAICCGTPVALYPYTSHLPYLQENGFWVKGIEDCKKIFESIKNNRVDFEKMSEASFFIAKNLLDYKKLAGRLYV